MPAPSTATSPFMVQARARYKQGDTATTGQRTREQAALRFYANEQWPEDIKASRSGAAATPGMPAVPARPTLTINKLREPVRQIQNQERASDFNIQITPADDFGDLGVTPDDTEIRLREGLVRRIQRESNADDARSWAFQRAVQCGTGYYRINTRYLPGRTFDQEICVERIFNQAAVVLDPSHTQPDGSDAEWGFIGYDLTPDRYKADFGTLPNGKANPIASAADSEWRALGDEFPKWFECEATGEDGIKTPKSVRVLEYFYKTHTSYEIALLEDGRTVTEEELGDAAAWAAIPADRKRRATDTVVKWAKIDGVQVLDETDWLGPQIPIIKVIGDELQPYDGERRVEGIVQNAMSAQMGFNMMMSKLVETVGLTPIPPLQLDPQAIIGSETWYTAAATRALPYLPYRTYDDEGRQLAPPVRAQVDPNLQPMAMAVSMFDGLIKSTTAVPDSTLGNVDPALKSGKAIREVVQNAQQSTSNFIDNLSRSMRFEAEIENDLLYPIYGKRPGRLVRMMTGEGEPEAVRIAVADAAQAGALQPAGAPATAPDQFKLTEDAKFNVAVKVSRSSLKRREEFVRMFSEIISAAPEQLTVAGDLLYKNMDIPESRELAERMQVMLAPPVQKYLASKKQGGNPAAQVAMLEGQLQLAQQQLQLADGAINELRQKADESQIKIHIAQLEGQRDIELERVRMQADVEKARIAAVQQDDQQAATIEIQRMKDAAAIRVKELDNESKGLVSQDAMQTQAIALAHDEQQAAAQREHESRVAEQGRRHEAEQAEAAAARESMNGDGGE